MKNSKTPPSLTLKMWIESMDHIAETGMTQAERDLATFARDLLERSPDSPTIQQWIDKRALTALEKGDSQ